MTEDTVQSCDACGASIYPEHIAKHTAERHEGKLLCPACLREKRTVSGGGKPTKSRIHGFSTGQSNAVHHERQEFRRPILEDSVRATRCKTFHCKLTDASIHHLNDQINEWVDAHDEVQIKFANSNVGVVEGKHSDPHLVITLFY